MQPIVAVIAAGMMGSGVGGRLAQNGIEVRTALAGRSAASVKRAQAAGMVGASDAQIAACDFILSIVPPGEALGLAEQLAPALRAAAKKPIYVDCNAVNPATVLRIARTVEETGTTFVDGGIIGGPPTPGSMGTKLYLSGPAAARVVELEQYGLEPRVQAGPIGAASAMKMSYAGITKGTQAVGAAMMLAAIRAGSAGALYDELAYSQNAALKQFKQQLPMMPAKAYRWVAEMQEIAGFVGEGSAAHELYEAAAHFYARMAEDFAADKEDTAALDAFLKNAPAK